ASTLPPQPSCSKVTGGPFGPAQRSPHAVRASTTGFKSRPLSVGTYSCCSGCSGFTCCSMSPFSTNPSRRFARTLEARPRLRWKSRHRDRGLLLLGPLCSDQQPGCVLSERRATGAHRSRAPLTQAVGGRGRCLLLL